MPKETSNAKVVNGEANPPEETVSKVQYDAVVKQVQVLTVEANRRISSLENDKKTLTAAINTINKLVEKLFASENK